MTAARYLAGAALLVVVLGPLALAAVAVRARVLPAWEGAPARLAECVVGLAALTGLLEALGAVGLFRLAAVAIAAPALGAALIFWARRAVPAAGGAARLRVPALERPAVLLALAAAALVAGSWTIAAVRGYDAGPFGLDSAWYHMPFAARFVQSGSTLGIPFTDVEYLAAYYPAGGELLHGLGILAFARDWLTPALNFAWLALGILGGWCIGRPRGVAPASAIGVAIGLALPLVALNQTGTGNNDAEGLALLIAAAALVLNAREEERAPLVLAAVALGLAVGTKLSLLAPAVAMALALLVAEPAGKRRALAGPLLGAMLIAGFYWYARNLVRTGNPLPFASLGPLPAPGLPHNGTSTSLVHYLGHPSVWRHKFFHGLSVSFGRVWPLVLIAGLGGLVAAVARRGADLVTRRERAIAAAGLVGAIAYVATPGTAAGPTGDPVQFLLNLRYLVPELALGLALLPRVPALAGPRARVWVAGALALLLALCQRTETLFPSDHREVGAAGAVAVVAIFTLTRRRPQARSLAAIGAALVVVVLAGGWKLEQRYGNHRYTAFDALGPQLSAWARHQHHQRIGVVGTAAGFSQYPLYGLDLSDRVRYVAHHGAHGAFTTITNCRTWRTALNAGHFDYLLITPHVDLWTFAPLAAHPPDEPA